MLALFAPLVEVVVRQRPAAVSGPRRLIHLGNVLVDVVAAVPALPAPGGDVLAARVRATVGGGFNLMAGGGPAGGAGRLRRRARHRARSPT